MASERGISPETLGKAVDSLLKWRKSQSETQQPKLFDQDEEFVYLVLTLKKIPPKGRVNPHKIPLPHSLLSPFSEQLLILDDRPNKARITKPQAQKKIQSESIPISKVLKLSKLASDYRPFEAKRKLCDSYYLFFAEKSIVPLLPRLLGKQFFKKRKIPVPLDLKKDNWKEQVERACSAAMLFLRTGTCSVVRVAKLSMERDEIVENLVAAIDGVVEVVPKKWANVRSFHVKLLDSIALPIYQVLPDLKLKIEGTKAEVEVQEKKKEKDEAGEINKKKKKGRIHEVMYMDDKVGEDESASDDDGGGDNNDEVGNGDYGVEDHLDSEDNEKGSGGLVNKKRKKGIKAEKVSPSVKKLKESPKEGVKRKKKDSVSVKAAKEGLVKKSEDKSSVKDEGSVKKKKRVDVNVKAKRSKKAV